MATDHYLYPINSYLTRDFTMNYLAHIFLSGTDRRVQVGNFIGDAVKGSSYNDYPPAIREGVLLHRAIDAFTDNHPVIKETIRTLRPDFGRYSGMLLDIFFDYLLASRFREFSDMPLKRFTRRFNWALIRNRRWLPVRIKRFMWHFIGTNRLTKYVTIAGVGESLDIMVRYRGIEIPVEKAMDYLAGHEEVLWRVFLPFFRELQAYCREYMETPKAKKDT